MRKTIALILFVLFSLGTFGVTIEQHLCCHSAKADSTSDLNHCKKDESCCGDNDDCCDEVVSQVKITKDFTSVNTKISLDNNGLAILCAPIFYSQFVARHSANRSLYPCFCYFPPPKNFQISYNSFLI